MPNGAATLFHSMPHPWISHVIVFDYDPTSGRAEPVLTGPVKVGNDEILAGLYDFCAAVVGFKPDSIAVHRYGPITRGHRISYPKRDASSAAGRDPNPARTAALAQARSLSLATITRASGSLSLEPSASGVIFRSAPDPWSYIGRMPLLAGCIPGGGWVAVDIRVTQGTVGLSVLDREGNEVLASAPAAARDNIQTVFLRLRSFAAAGDLVLRNWNKRSSSEGILQAVRIAAGDGPTPAACDPEPARTKALAQARSLSLETMTRASEAAVSLEPSASGVAFRSAPNPWAYIGRMPLLAGCIQGGGWVAADVRITHGTVGIGVLNRRAITSWIEARLRPSATSRPFFYGSIPLPAPATLFCKIGMRNRTRRGSFRRCGSPPRMDQHPRRVIGNSVVGMRSISRVARCTAHWMFGSLLKILVTCCAGYLGSRVTAHLLQAGIRGNRFRQAGLWRGSAAAFTRHERFKLLCGDVRGRCRCCCSHRYRCDRAFCRARLVVGLFSIGGGRPTILAVAVLAFAVMNGFEDSCDRPRETVFDFSYLCRQKQQWTAIYSEPFRSDVKKMYVWWNEQEVLKASSVA